MTKKDNEDFEIFTNVGFVGFVIIIMLDVLVK